MTQLFSLSKKIGPRLSLLIVSITLFFVRLLPEFWIGATPIGNDSSTSYVDAYYHYTASFLHSLTHFNLYYYLLHLAHSLEFDSFIVLKVSGVALYLFVIVSFFWLLRCLFPNKSITLLLLGTFLFATQVGVLRISWDLFRNEIGLIGLIVTLASSVLFYRKKLIFLVGIIFGALLTVTSHQLCTLVLAHIFIVFFCVWISKRIPFLVNRRWILCMVWIPIWLSISKYINQPGGVTLRETSDVLEQYSTHLEGLLFLVLFIPMLPLSIWGAIKHRFTNPAIRTVLLSLTFLILIQSLMGLVLPSITFSHADRWLFFLTIPLAILSFAGLTELRKAPAITFFLGFWLITQSIISFYFWWPSLSLFSIKSINPIVYNVFPARMVSNNLIASEYDKTLVDTLPECAAELQSIFQPTTTFYLEYKYYGIANHYFTQSMISSAHLADTLPIGQPGEAYAFGYDLHPPNSWQQIYGDTCPIYYYLPHQKHR